MTATSAEIDNIDRVKKGFEAFAVREVRLHQIEHVQNAAFWA